MGKASVFDEKGNIVSFSFAKSIVYTSSENRFEQDAEKIWLSVIKSNKRYS